MKTVFALVAALANVAALATAAETPVKDVVTETKVDAETEDRHYRGGNYDYHGGRYGGGGYGGYGGNRGYGGYGGHH